MSDTTEVLIIPADPSAPCRIKTVQVESELLLVLREVVEGYPESAQYDHDVTTFVNDNGAGSMPRNERATEYAFKHSLAASQKGASWPNPPYWLYGDVALVGADGCIPERLLPVFGFAPQGPGVEL